MRAAIARPGPTTCPRPTGPRGTRTRRAPWVHRPDGARSRRCRRPRRCLTSRRRSPARRDRDAHGFEDAAVAGAAAQVAGEGLADREIVGLRVAVEQVVHGHHQTGRAEPALHRALVHERLLHVRERAALVGLDPFDRDDLAADRRGSELEARADEHAVDQDRARTALALLATRLRAGQLEALAQHVQEALTQPCVLDRVRLAVHREAVHAHGTNLCPLWTLSRVGHGSASTEDTVASSTD